MTGIRATSSSPVGEQVGQPAGHVEQQFDAGRQLLQVADERLGVQVVDRTDADGSVHEIVPR